MVLAKADRVQPLDRAAAARWQTTAAGGRTGAGRIGLLAAAAGLLAALWPLWSYGNPWG
ncbi:hypothetical protein [Kitasatospora sp. NPDC059571]|uniref:hypothetical protein n=1 Tax=Kitasatospora sp. NPDC059571 TaxID=3346871 RepID=UPI0036785ECC